MSIDDKSYTTVALCHCQGLPACDYFSDPFFARYAIAICLIKGFLSFRSVLYFSSAAQNMSRGCRGGLKELDDSMPGIVMLEEDNTSRDRALKLGSKAWHAVHCSDMQQQNARGWQKHCAQRSHKARYAVLTDKTHASAGANILRLVMSILMVN